MSEELRKEYAAKYVRTGADVMVAKENNPYPAMKYDTVKFVSDENFGNMRVEGDFQYIWQPCKLVPEPVQSECNRYLVFGGGTPVNQIELGGEVEITIGNSLDDLHVFKFDQAVDAFIKKGMYYAVNVTKVNDENVPVYFNDSKFDI